MRVNTASRNPYENAELFATLERLRRVNELDAHTETELGELLMSTARIAITCMMSNGAYLKDAPDELESEALLKIIEVSRKADTDDPKRFVSCLVKSAQLRIKWLMRDTRKHNNIILPYMSDDDPIERSCELDGTPIHNVYEQIKLFSKKEPEDGQKDL